MAIIITGWYESEDGAIMVDETGNSLSEIVYRMMRRDPENFGYTDCEFELHLPDGSIKLVENKIMEMVKNEFVHPLP